MMMQDSLSLLQNSLKMQKKRLPKTELQAYWNYYHAQSASNTFLIKLMSLVHVLGNIEIKEALKAQLRI
jgi:hypothetical protein